MLSKQLLSLWLSVALTATVTSAENIPFEVLSSDSIEDVSFMESWNSTSTSSDRAEYLAGLEDLTFDFSREDLMGAPEVPGGIGIMSMMRSSRSAARYATTDEFETMRRATNYANAAYCQRGLVEKWKCRRCTGGDTRGAKSALYFHGKRTDSVGYVTANIAQKQIVVAYRGTKTLRNWLHNLAFFKVNTHWPDARDKNAKVHVGFYKTFYETKEIVFKKLFQLIKEHPGYSVVFTGHSLGGALATLATLGFMERAEDMGLKVKTSFISVASPRVGNSHFARYFQQKAIAHDVTLYRIVHQRDVVPHLPLARFGFRHVTKEAWINKKNQKPRICSATNGEDRQGSNSLRFPINIGHHTEAWNIKLGGDAC